MLFWCLPKWEEGGKWAWLLQRGSHETWPRILRCSPATFSLFWLLPFRLQVLIQQVCRLLPPKDDISLIKQVLLTVLLEALAGNLLLLHHFLLIWNRWSCLAEINITGWVRRVWISLVGKCELLVLQKFHLEVFCGIVFGTILKNKFVWVWGYSFKLHFLLWLSDFPTKKQFWWSPQATAKFRLLLKLEPKPESIWKFIQQHLGSTLGQAPFLMDFSQDVLVDFNFC